jgi:hypothetical protein
MSEKDVAFIAQKAARMIYFGLSQKTRILEKNEFQELITEYKNNIIFRNTVENISKGLKVQIIGLDDTGLVLLPEVDSIFIEKSARLKKLLEPEMKLYTLLILLGLAAYYFPRKSSFEEDIQYTEPLNLNEFDTYLKKKCLELKNKTNVTNSIKNVELSKIPFIEYLALSGPSEIDSKARNTSQGVLKKIFNFLIEEKLFIEKEAQFWPTHRFRHHIERMAENIEIKQLIDKLRDENHA